MNINISLEQLTSIISTAVKEAIGESFEQCGYYKPIQSQSANTVYDKTERLLKNYSTFKRIVAEREEEIATVRKHGVPRKHESVVGHTVQQSIGSGIVLEEESVESTVRKIQHSVQGTVQAISMIDKAMYALRYDPYYEILPMLYFEGRTQEDVALELGCSQVSISKNKTRLIGELAIRLFPHQAVQEMME